MGVLLVSLCLGLAMAAPARDLEEFMRNHGFSNLTEQFNKHQVTMELLPELTDGDLRELGLGLVGRRRLFARAVRSLAIPPVEEGGVVVEGGVVEEGGVMEEGGREEERGTVEARGEEDGGERVEQVEGEAGGEGGGVEVAGGEVGGVEEAGGEGREEPIFYKTISVNGKRVICLYVRKK